MHVVKQQLPAATLATLVSYPRSASYYWPARGSRSLFVIQPFGENGSAVPETSTDLEAKKDGVRHPLGTDFLHTAQVVGG